MSFPVRERGLKLYTDLERHEQTCVVPRAGTWIETYPFVVKQIIEILSFPVRERGLKLAVVTAPCTDLESFPVRERGL